MTEAGKRRKRRFGLSDFAKYLVFFIPLAIGMWAFLMPGYIGVIFTIDRWKVATATVDSTEVDYSFFRGMIDKYQRYVPLVHYTFEVDGKTYKGSHIGYPSGERYSSNARADIAAYHPGDKIQVFYDPESPDTGAIEKPSYGWLYGWLALTFGIIVFTVVSVLLKQWKRDKEDAA